MIARRVVSGSWISRSPYGPADMCCTIKAGHMLAPDHLLKTVEKRLASQGASTHVATRPNSKSFFWFDFNLQISLTNACVSPWGNVTHN